MPPKRRRPNELSPRYRGAHGALPVAPVVRIGLGHAARIEDPQAGQPRSQHAEAHGDAMIVVGLDFHRRRAAPRRAPPASGSMRIQSGPSSTVTPSLRNSRVGAAIRSHSFTRNVASPVMCVAASGTAPSSSAWARRPACWSCRPAPSKAASSRRGPSITVLSCAARDARRRVFRTARRRRSRPGACASRDWRA